MRALLGTALIAVALSAGCWRDPKVVVGAPSDIGFTAAIAAPAPTLFDTLPTAITAAGLELHEMVERGPTRFVAIGLVPAGMGGDGQWARVVIEPRGPNVSVVTVFSLPRGGGIAENPDSTARNLLLNLIVLCSPEAQAPALAAARRSALQPNGGQ
jgi:hypothetical protein